MPGADAPVFTANKFRSPRVTAYPKPGLYPPRVIEAGFCRMSLLRPGVRVCRRFLTLSLLVEVGRQNERIVEKGVDRGVVVVDGVGVGFRRSSLDIREPCHFETRDLLGLEGALREDNHIAISQNPESKFVLLDFDDLRIGVSIRSSLLRGPLSIDGCIFRPGGQ